jgi:hypothetical protein
MLEQSSDVDSMNGLIGTFYRYATIWTCMDVMPTIVKALDIAHHGWKSRGVPSHSLLTLLLKFDNCLYLSETSRGRLVADIEAFTQVKLYHFLRSYLNPICRPCDRIHPTLLLLQTFYLRFYYWLETQSQTLHLF